jgi:ketosteroid isomerase-like protein
MEKLATWIAVAGRGSAARSFQAFLQRRASAAESYVNGDAQPLSEVLARQEPATFLSPRGDMVSGADAVAARYVKDAGAFQRGGHNRIEVLQSAASGDVAWWTGHQLAEARLDGKDAPVTMNLRVTEAFRFAADGWNLVHPHAGAAKSTPGQ